MMQANDNLSGIYYIYFKDLNDQSIKNTELLKAVHNKFGKYLGVKVSHNGEYSISYAPTGSLELTDLVIQNPDDLRNAIIDLLAIDFRQQLSDDFSFSTNDYNEIIYKISKKTTV